MRTRPAIVVVAVATLMLLPSSAAADKRCSAEEVAALDQYCELITSAEAKLPIAGTMPRLRDSLPRGARRKLAAAGAPGTALLALPDPAPRAGPAKPLSDVTGAIAGRLGRERKSLERTARALGSVTGGESGLGRGFAWALLFITVAAAGIAWVRRRA